MNELVGRKVMKKEVKGNVDFSKAVCFSGMTVASDMVCCNRCGSNYLKNQVELSQGHYFCPSCIQLGRVDSLAYLYHLPEVGSTPRTVCFEWSGRLTVGQRTVSDWLQRVVLEKRRGMIWAVTGAGKTEMLFETLHASLARGERVGIASPRVDVCLELYPRLQTVFPSEQLLLLYGAAEEAYRYTKFVLCTTHQLLRFYQAFDLLIIDEVDAFPFVDEPLLQKAAEAALKESASLIYLTATPTKRLLHQVEAEMLAMSILPARYHRRALPVPKLRSCFHWREKIERQIVPKALLSCIRSLIEKNNVLLFCPSIAVLNNVYKLIVDKFSDIPTASVHSKDEERAEKVMQMRKNEFRLFLTTTILERGVTFERVSVIVLGAEHPVFSEAALVQISGRVDRKSEYTAGEVWFLHDGRNRQIKQAVRQIKKMNRLAAERGLIDDLHLLRKKER